MKVVKITKPNTNPIEKIFIKFKKGCSLLKIETLSNEKYKKPTLNNNNSKQRNIIEYIEKTVIIY
jgi:hypothetical protein